MKTSNPKKVKQYEKKCAKQNVLKEGRKLITEGGTEERGKGNFCSQSCGKCSMSGLSVMQHEHVRGQRHPMQRREFSESGLLVPKMPRPTSVFQVKDQKYRPYSASPSAFFRHMHVLHSTCCCLEPSCTCKQSIFFYMNISIR